MKLNNKGMSLVELVVVVAIMAVLVGSSVSIVIAVNNAKTKSCAQSIYSSLGRVKTNTMSKEKGSATAGSQQSYFEIYTDADGTTVTEGVNGVAVDKKIGAKEILVSYKTSETASPSTLGSTHVRVEYNRSNGSISYTAVGSTATNIYSFVIEGARAKYEVVLYHATGKSEMKRIA